MPITRETLESYERDFARSPANAVAMNAVTSMGVAKASANPEVQRISRVYSLDLKQGDITNQKSSGRCWMFAALNTMRFQIIHKLNLESFELSQSYPLFFDKLEKANFFLESILDTLDEPLSGRLMAHLLSAPMNDGGQWDMFCGIVEKYGVVPKSAMPETACSSATGEMNHYLTSKLRAFAAELREAHASGAPAAELRARKDEMMSVIYRMLTICLGTPPKTVTFEARDKDDKFIRDANLTPQAFYAKYVGIDLAQYVSVINAPTADKPYERMFGIKFLGSVHEGRPIRYLNLPSAELKRLAVAQLKDGEPVWFGSDVGKSLAREGGLMRMGAYAADKLFSTDFPMDKAHRLDYGESLMTHAMVLMGCNLDDEGRSLEWRVENSWGKDAGVDGYFTMSDAWFDEYAYQVVVNRKYLTDEQRALLDTDPIMLEPWDPMGSLA